MIRNSAIATAIVILTGPLTLAQPQAPGGGASRPTFSPYLNLLGGGGAFNNPAFSYFGIVRPQQQYAQQLGALQQQLSMTGQQLNNIQDLQSQQSQAFMPYTGNVPVFNSYGGYFNRIGMGSGFGGGGMGMGGGPSSFNTIGGLSGGMNPSSRMSGGLSGVSTRGSGGGLGFSTGMGGIGQPSFSRPVSGGRR